MSIASAPAPGDWDYRAFSPIPFARFRDELLALYAPPLRARKTMIKLRFTLDIAAGLLGPDATTADLNPALVARFIAGRPAAESPHTTFSLLSNLRTACSYAKSQGYVRNSPFEFRAPKKWIRVPRAAGKKHHPQEDIRRVLELLRSEVLDREGWSRWRARRLYALAATVAYTGLRRDEALFLRVEDVDIPGRMIFVVDRASRRLKTEGSAAPVPMPEALVPILESWMPHRLSVPEPCAGKLPECPYLFPNVTRTNAWSQGPWGAKPLDALKAAGLRAGVANFTFQSLRHSFATHAESWGLSPTMIQRVLRHTSLRTQEHYRHADQANMRAAVNRVGFGDGPEAGPEGGPSA